MADRSKFTRVLFVCTGLGIINRGIETFFREAFDGLKDIPGLKLHLMKGAGDSVLGEHVISGLARTSATARALGWLTRRNGYVIEQWSSFLSVVAQIRRMRPHVIFYSDANLGFLLFWLRRWIGVPYALLFSNGGPVHPPFIRTDFVHQVAPCYYDEALAAGEPKTKHFLVPYGIKVLPPPSRLCTDERVALRRLLGLPVERAVVLSVGWIRRVHKRMDWLIREMARLPEPRPFLQLVGAMDSGSAEIVQLGHQLLGDHGFGACSLPYEKVSEFYRAADCFVLASLQEGFGRVYLEALMHGLPVIAHDNPVTRHVIGQNGVLADLTQPGNLGRLLARELETGSDPGAVCSRWQSIQKRFSWPVLAWDYATMFRTCAARVEAVCGQGAKS